MLEIANNDDRWKAIQEFEGKNGPNTCLKYFRGALINGKCGNIFQDTNFINFIFTQPIATAFTENNKYFIGDFGSAYGHVAKTVVSQLKEKKYDHDAIPIGFDPLRKDFWRKYKPAPVIKTFRRDLRDILGKANTFDAGILRFVLPFIPVRHHLKMFKQIHNVLKPGAILVVLNDGVLDKEMAKNYNRLFKECAAIFKSPTKKYVGVRQNFSFYKDFERMATDAGFEVQAHTDLTDIALCYVSPDVFLTMMGHRGAVKYEKQLENVFARWEQKDVLPFEPKRDSLRVLWPMYSCELRCVK